jgi:serine/threonine-protein kinase
MRGLSRKREVRFSHGKEMAKAIEQAYPEIFEEETIAAEMQSLFEDKIATTRALLELAKNDDAGGMTKAVEALVDESPDGTPRAPKRAPTSGARQKATPMPREGVPSARPRSSGKLPRVTDEAMGAAARAKKSGADRFASKVNRDYAMYDASEAETEQAAQTDARRADTQDVPSVRPRRPAPGARNGGSGGFGGIVFLVLFVAIVGGLVWAGLKGPLKDSGLAVAFRAWLDHELNGEPPAPPPPPLDQVKPGGVKPQWLIEKEAHQAQEAADAEKRRAIEEAANDPETQKTLEEINAQLKDLDRQEADLRQLKIDAKATGAQGQQNATKIEALEKEIAEMKKGIAEKQAKAEKRRKREAGEVEVVRDTKSAKNADVGYLSLYTVNPSKAAVFDGPTALGTTPLSKVPLEVGTHVLRVVDGDAQNRTLQVTIEAGKTADVKGVDVSSMPLAN